MPRRVGILWDLGYLPPVLIPSGSHQNMYGWQASGTHPTGMLSCYHPQTKFAKVMFLHMSVILSTGGGVVVSKHVLQVSRSTPRGKLRSLAWGVSRPTLRGVSRTTPRGGVSRPTPGGSPGTHLGDISACTEADTSLQQTSTAAGMHSCL